MKKAKINVEQYVDTPSMQIAKDLGLAEDDVASIQSKLLGVEEKEEKLRIEEGEKQKKEEEEKMKKEEEEKMKKKKNVKDKKLKKMKKEKEN